MDSQQPEKPNSKKRQRPWQHAVAAGMVSGAVSRFVSAPFDLVKIRFQLQTAPIARSGGGLYASLFQAFRSIYKEEGLRTFWRCVI